jgi:AcrR family transcriptional regulator
MLLDVSPRATAADAARTRAAILDRAVLRASVEGFEAVSIGTLATDLGMSKAGVIGPFGTKTELQLATLDRGAELFRREVWDPAAELPAGRVRLRAVIARWHAYLALCPLPGGCLMTTAMVEWDTRPGPVRDAVAAFQRRWLRTLAADGDVAIRAGELPAEPGPEQLAFELNGISLSLNLALRLWEDPAASDRARAAAERLLGPLDGIPGPR